MKFERLSFPHLQVLKMKARNCLDTRWRPCVSIQCDFFLYGRDTQFECDFLKKKIINRFEYELGNLSISITVICCSIVENKCSPNT